MRPLRNPVIQTVLANILAVWMRFCVATTRWTHENKAVAEQVWADGGPVICVFWHSRISLTPACWPHDRAQEVRAIVSLSPDGQFIARAMGKVGFPSIRGSSANKDKAAKDKSARAKGGSAALRDALRQLKVGGVALTPDGPRGPMRQMGDGLAVMAKLSGAPVLFIGLSCNPAIRLGSWDRAILPLPFGKGAIVWDIDRYPDDVAPSDVALAWTDRLTAVEARADELTGLERI